MVGIGEPGRADQPLGALEPRRKGERLVQPSPPMPTTTCSGRIRICQLPNTVL